MELGPTNSRGNGRALAQALVAVKGPPEPSESHLKDLWLYKIHNLQLAWKEYRSRKLTLDSLPYRAIVELTQNCNFKCIMCPQSWDAKYRNFDKSLNMPLETFVKIADAIFPAATFIDLRGFGETTILPYWPEVADYLARFPFVQWHLVTNLSLRRDTVWEKMIQLGFEIGFSCDGATKETFEKIRVRGNFATIRHNLGLIRDSISKHKKGYLYFISTIQKNNIHELQALVELAHEFAVPEVQFKTAIGCEEDWMLNKVPSDVIQRNVLKAIDTALDLKVRLNFNDWQFTQYLNPIKVARADVDYVKRPKAILVASEFAKEYDKAHDLAGLFQLIQRAERVSENQGCFKPFSFTYVDYRAKMGTCNHMMYPDMNEMGDLNVQSLTEIWNGSRYLDFRRELLEARPTDVRCQWCFKHRLFD